MAAGSRMDDRERVEVMLSVLPWLAATGGAPLEVAARTFGVDPGALRADLMTVFYDVEPEVGADRMVEVFIDAEDDDFVTVHLPGSFEEPPELDPAEALGLLAAGVALLGQPGIDAALGPAVDKLQKALGVAGASAVQVDLGAGDPALRSVLGEATAKSRVVELCYFAWSSDSVSQRRVDPWTLRSIEGNWYLSGWCHDREELRHFRLDRVIDAAASDDEVTHSAPATVPPPMWGERSGRTVTVEVPSQDAWVVDSLPTRSFEEIGDRVKVTLDVLSAAWLDRLLVALGSDAVVHDSDGEDLTERRRAVARRMRDRLDAVGSL